MKNQIQLVAGLGEIGKPMCDLLKKSGLVLGYDINPKLMKKKINTKKNGCNIFTYLYSFYTKFFYQCKITL